MVYPTPPTYKLSILYMEKSYRGSTAGFDFVFRTREYEESMGLLLEDIDKKTKEVIVAIFTVKDSKGVANYALMYELASHFSIRISYRVIEILSDLVGDDKLKLDIFIQALYDSDASTLYNLQNRITPELAIAIILMYSLKRPFRRRQSKIFYTKRTKEMIRFALKHVKRIEFSKEEKKQLREAIKRFHPTPVDKEQSKLFREIVYGREG